MTLTDPIADLLTRIRNAQSAGKPTVGVGASKLKLAILKVLKDEGYIGGYGVDAAGAKSTLSIELKYHDGRPVIDRIERISRPGLRIYRGKDELPKVLGGLGVAVISTPKGIMSDAQARSWHRRRAVYCSPIGSFIGLKVRLTCHESQKYRLITQGQRHDWRDAVTVKGAKGSLTLAIKSGIKIVQQDSTWKCRQARPPRRMPSRAQRARPREHGHGRHQGLRRNSSWSASATAPRCRRRA